MKSENKRIFINDLPETVTQDELENNFSKYGQVTSIEIKERKELGPNNKSLFFAYVNLVTDHQGINQCFQELSQIKWHDQYVQFQIARESFLERLKREREESQQDQQNNIVADVTTVPVKQVIKENGFDSSRKQQTAARSYVKKILKQYKSSTESESETTESEKELKDDLKSVKIAETVQATRAGIFVLEPEEKLDIVIKSNRGRNVDKGGLKIPSVGKEPIIKVTKNKVKLNDSKANLKRLHSLREMKKNYTAQKSLIKNSLSYGVKKPNTKIIFADNGADDFMNITNNGLKKNSLFDDDDSEDASDFEVNFNIKSGQKLLELQQSTYQNDKRFALDKRFIDDKNEDDAEPMETEDISKEGLEAEKRAQLKILGEVLGKDVTPSKDQSSKDSAKKKTMLRFDPSQPDHSKLELTVVESEEKKKKNKKARKDVQEQLNPEPEVSKEVFYKVTENLKETFEEKQQFSLLSIFGKVEDKGELQESKEKEIKRNPLLKSQNPFKYDSSDDEYETEDIPHKDEIVNNAESKPPEHRITKASPAVFWTEPFFFKTDDFRLQEGLDFIEKIKTENKEFLKIRRDLKGIVKAKVRNNERKNKMFKKKLGGSKRRKHIRIKKALKR